MHRSNKVPFKGTLTSKAFSIFLALTLCVPTTLAGNLSHVRQAQADTSVPQEQSTGGDALDSAPDGDSVGEAADSAQAQDAPDSPALSPALDWGAQYQALMLSSKGLTVDVQKLIESARESGATLSSGDTQAQAAQSGEFGRDDANMRRYNVRFQIQRQIDNRFGMLDQFGISFPVCEALAQISAEC